MTKDRLAELTDLILEFRNERNWKQFHQPKDTFLSLVLEATELLELAQWKSKDEILASLKKDPEPFADELADVFYWVLLIAHDLDIDLEKSLKNKLKKNILKYPLDKYQGKSSISD